MSKVAEIDLDKASAFNCIAWILNNELVNENGSPIEFRDHSFLIDPFTDDTPRQVIKKASQVGWSTLAILRSFHLAKFAKANIIHTFPSRSIAKDFVIPKVDPLIQSNKSLKAEIGVDSASLKQVGDRFIYYRGSYEQTEAISISAHILVNDEYDRSNQRVLKTYRTRLDDAMRERPELGWEWQFSNPSIPGAGVDILWQKSDQKHWFVRCRHCGHFWYLKWPESINFETKERICEKCHNVYSKDDLRDGQWVKKYKYRDISGYWVSQLFVPWISAEKIIDASEDDPEIFHNFTLGQPYISKDASLSRDSIIKCLNPGYNPKTNVAIGVDNAIKKHYVIGNRYGIFDFGVTDDWDEIEGMRNRYGAVMVIDALPYPHTPNRLSEKYPGKVFVHYYQQDKKQVGTIRWDTRLVKSDRTKIIDFVVAELNSQDVRFNKSQSEMEEYIDHWENMFRVIDMTPQGVVKPKWRTLEGKPDHFAHATVLWRLALEKTLSVGGIVKTARPIRRGEEHPFVSADQTVSALNLEEAVKRADKYRRKWKS